MREWLDTIFNGLGAIAAIIAAFATWPRKGRGKHRK